MSMFHDNQGVEIHPTAVVSPEARLGHNVFIGPYCIVGPHVEISDNVKLISHVVINGHTQVGEHNIIYPFACLGDPPQDKKFQGEVSKLIIGSHNMIGHYVAFNGGTEHGDQITRIGNHCMFMNGSHVGHDCEVGNHVTLTNNVLLAGHVKVYDNVVIGGGSAILQHIRIGQGAMVGGMSGVGLDVIPYSNVLGQRAVLRGLNVIGMKRLNISKVDVHVLHKAYQMLFDTKTGNNFEQRVERVKQEYSNNTYVKEVLIFIQDSGKRSICMPGFDEK